MAYTTYTSTAQCAPGKLILGGGAEVTQTGATQAVVMSSYPSNPDTWTATAIVLVVGDTVTVTAYALCSL